MLPLIGPNGLKHHVEVCLVKLQMQPLGLCLPLAGEKDCEVLSSGGNEKQVEITEGIIFPASFASFRLRETLAHLCPEKGTQHHSENFWRCSRPSG